VSGQGVSFFWAAEPLVGVRKSRASTASAFALSEGQGR
jgi:hypothetical protein